jgi:hypothetical protein
MKKKDRKTTILGIIGAVGLFLSSPEVRPVYDVTPPIVKQVGAIMAMLGVGAGLKVAADAKKED